MQLDINRTLQICLAIAGAGALVAYFRSWRSDRRLLYDVPAATAMCAYMAQLICEGRQALFTPFWWVRLVLMVPLSVIPVGRACFGWRISGHVTTMLAVGLIQALDARLTFAERILYGIPLPIVFLMHWFYWDRVEHGGRVDHRDTINALAAGFIIFLFSLIEFLFRG